MELGIGSLVGGVFIVLLSFIWAAVNMYRGMTGGGLNFAFDDMIKNHLGAMIGMAIGSFISFIGFVIIAINLFNTYVG